MSRRWLAVLTLVAALGFFTTDAAAKGNPKGKGNGAAKAAHNDFDRGHDDHGRAVARHDGWERHDKHEVRVFGPHDGRPPGWSRGRKTGWGNCGVPPGHAKKGECRYYVYHGHPYYYYHDDYGRIVVRRPLLHVHAGVDIVR